jgi:cobalamin-dependent methionine synthase I
VHAVRTFKYTTERVFTLIGKERERRRRRNDEVRILRTAHAHKWNRRRGRRPETTRKTPERKTAEHERIGTYSSHCRGARALRISSLGQLFEFINEVLIIITVHEIVVAVHAVV